MALVRGQGNRRFGAARGDPARRVAGGVVAQAVREGGRRRREVTRPAARAVDTRRLDRVRRAHRRRARGGRRAGSSSRASRTRGRGATTASTARRWFIVAFFAWALIMALLRRLRSIRYSPDGEAAAARWLGVKRFLAARPAVRRHRAGRRRDLGPFARVRRRDSASRAARSPRSRSKWRMPTSRGAAPAATGTRCTSSTRRSSATGSGR